jgi:hypothetical protein
VAQSVRINSGASLSIEATASLSINGGAAGLGEIYNEGTLTNNGTLNIGNTA